MERPAGAVSLAPPCGRLVSSGLDIVSSSGNAIHVMQYNAPSAAEVPKRELMACIAGGLLPREQERPEEQEKAGNCASPCNETQHGTLSP